MAQHFIMAYFGFEAFLVKIGRVPAPGVGPTASLGFWANRRSAVQVAVFLNQILGVVQLNVFTEERLFQFIFGGTDNFIGPHEKRRKFVWEALLSEDVELHDPEYLVQENCHL